MNNAFDGFADDEETVVQSEETTLVSTRRPVPQAQPRPTVTLRKPALPSRGNGSGLMRFLKPDGRHYNRKLLAAGGLLAILALFGVLVLRAVGRRFGTDAAQPATVEEAVAKKPLTRREAVTLSAGGPPAQKQRAGLQNDFRGDKAAYLNGEYTPEVSSRQGATTPQQYGYSAPQSLPASPRRSRYLAGGRTTEGQAAAPTVAPNSAPSSPAFAAAWARSMAERVPGFGGVVEAKVAEDAPQRQSAPPAQAPSAAPPSRGVTLALTLIEPITSGIAAPVRARVASDVKDSAGRVIIPHGSIATIPFLAAEVHGRIPQDRNAPVTVTLPDGREMTFKGLVRGADGLPGVTGKVTKAKGGPGLLKRMLGLGGRASSVALSAAGAGAIVSPSDVAAMAGGGGYASVGSSRDASVLVPVGGMITLTVGL